MGWKTRSALVALIFGAGIWTGATYRPQSPLKYTDFSSFPPRLDLQSPLQDRESFLPEVDGMSLGYEDLGTLGLSGPFLYSNQCRYKLPEKIGAEDSTREGCFVAGKQLQEYWLGNKADRARLKEQ